MNPKLLISFVLGLVVIILAWFLFAQTTSTPLTDTPMPTPAVDQSQSCQESGGTWLAEHAECEYISPKWCEAASGTFAECESACRHDPEAEICTLQCVPVCSL